MTLHAQIVAEAQADRNVAEALLDYAAGYNPGADVWNLLAAECDRGVDRPTPDLTRAEAACLAAEVLNIGALAAYSARRNS